MPDLVEQLYCSQQIHIPPNLPSILKKYAKAAIRTQPYDLLVWSAAYFQAIADGVPPPVKLRIEYPPVETSSGLSPGFLRVLINQLGKEGNVPRKIIREKWYGVCLSREGLHNILKIGRLFDREIDWLQFVAIAAGTLEPNLTRTMILICELLTEEPEGGSAIIPLKTFMTLYRYLAKLDCGPDDPYPKPPSLPSVEGQETGIEYKKESSESEHTLDSVIRETGKPSLLSVDTVRMDTAQSMTGLMVWPDATTSEEEQPDFPEPKPSDEGVTSAYGIQVWDETSDPDIQKKMTEKTEPGDLEVLSGKSLAGEEESKEEEKDAKELDETEQEEETGSMLEDLDHPRTSQEMEEIKKFDDVEEADDEYNKFVAEVGEQDDLERKGEDQFDEELSFIKEMEESAADLKATEIKGEEEESKEEIVDVVDFVEDKGEDEDDVSVEASGMSFESEGGPGGPIKPMADQSVTSVGQPLVKKQSIEDVRIDLHPEEEPKEEESDLETVFSDSPFWMHVPGIGPVVPECIIDAVSDYMVDCAEKQCGMVMPRNIRHFLCPPLEELVPDQACYTLEEYPC